MAAPDQTKLTGTIRDFTPVSLSNFPDIQPHPDFQMSPGPDEQAAFPDKAQGFGVVKGIVKDTLGADGKPVYAGNPKTLWTNGKEQFDRWYGSKIDPRTTVTNYELVLKKVSDNPLQYVFDSADPKLGVAVDGTNFANIGGFFPIDGKLLGNSGQDDQGRNHNFHFTFEAHSQFTYKGGEVFRFTGDDDLWIFINKKLVIDLGGVHSKSEATISLDAIAGNIGLQKGTTYPFDVFYAERHTSQSNCRIETSIVFIQSVPTKAQILPAGDAQKVDPTKDGAFKIKLDKPAPAGGLRVFYEIVSGGSSDAASGVDFEPLALSVMVNGTEATIPVKPKPTQNVNATKPLTVRLVKGTGYEITTPEKATINIIDKAPAPKPQPLPTVSVTPGPNAKRPGSVLQSGNCVIIGAVNSFFTITRSSENSDQPLEVKCSLGGDARLGEGPTNDYLMPGFNSSSVTFAAGKTSIQLPVNPTIVAGLRNKDMTIVLNLTAVEGKYSVDKGSANLVLNKEKDDCAHHP